MFLSYQYSQEREKGQLDRVDHGVSSKWETSSGQDCAFAKICDSRGL